MKTRDCVRRSEILFYHRSSYLSEKISQQLYSICVSSRIACMSLIYIFWQWKRIRYYVSPKELKLLIEIKHFYLPVLDRDYLNFKRDWYTFELPLPET